MATSVFQNIRAALATAIASQLATDLITGVTVTQYPPLGEVTLVDRVWMDEISFDQEPLAMGGSSRKVSEDLSVEVKIRAIKPGGDLDDLALMEVRAEAILASVESALRADSDVNSTVMFAELESGSSKPFALDQQVGVLIEAVIHAEANL